MGEEKYIPDKANGWFTQFCTEKQMDGCLQVYSKARGSTTSSYCPINVIEKKKTHTKIDHSYKDFKKVHTQLWEDCSSVHLIQKSHLVFRSESYVQPSVNLSL